MKKKQAKIQPRFDVVPSYKGGHTLLAGSGSNYVYEFYPGHRLQNQWGWVAQHRLVAEDKLGRQLRPGEHVHHVDENPQNNHPDNLQILTQSEHRSLHARKMAEKQKIQLPAIEVQRILKEEGGIKPAAKRLGINHCSLRNHFPELCKPYRRVSPTKIDDPRDIEIILQKAPDSQVGAKELGKELKMSPHTILRICKRHGIPWKKKSRKGEIHKTYCGKPIQKKNK